MIAVVESLLPHVREMQAADVPEIAAIENETYAFPWGQGIFLDCLRASYYCQVLVRDDLIAGYCIMAVGVEEAHILNLCIRSSLRRLGYGRLLLNELMHYAHDIDAEYVFLEVRPSNEAALCLYENIGFVRIGTRKAYYRSAGGRENAIVLALEMAR